MDSELRGRTTSDQAAASTPANSPGRGRATAALVSVCLGFFVIQLDVTIVNVALPAIQHQIGGSLAGLQWVVDAYTLALASIMLTAGSTADRIGARKTFTFGLAAFAVGSAACAAAPALGVLVAARAVQGLGASAMLPCSLALIVHQYPEPSKRARALGVWGGMGSLGVALGPVAGGILVTLAGWRSIFLVNVPICLVTRSWWPRPATWSPSPWPGPPSGTADSGYHAGVARRGPWWRVRRCSRRTRRGSAGTAWSPGWARAGWASSTWPRPGTASRSRSRCCARNWPTTRSSGPGSAAR